ncbi:RYR2 protein, partial [Daphoenositta chrysoptera]|nr:RYR2 protein [Daphoenositta chrysoptera]
TLQQLISDTMVRWAQESVIEDPELVRAMFVLLHRQYDGIGGLVRALPKTYTINSVSVEDTINLLASLGQIRSLLSVRMGKEEEKLMIRGLGLECLGRLIPLRSFSKHEALVQKGDETAFGGIITDMRFSFRFWEKSYWESKTLIVSNNLLHVSSFKRLNFLCLSVRVLASPSMRGSTPLDVAAASVMDNNELALALREPDLEKVVRYLAGCGLQSCPLLICKGYPDIGWNPVEGERYLDFLRFAVFCNGESVEENANVVVRLLIR